MHCRHGFKKCSATLCHSNVGHLRELKLGCFYVHSLGNKLIEVTALLHDHGVNIACISKTWLIGEDKPVVMEINEVGYQMLHVPCATHGGDVGILYKPNLSIQSRHCKIGFNSFEIIRTVLHIGSEETLLIACLYRPCNAGLSKSSIDNFFF